MLTVPLLRQYDPDEKTQMAVKETLARLQSKRAGAAYCREQAFSFLTQSAARGNQAKIIEAEAVDDDVARAERKQGPLEDMVQAALPREHG